jgi:hypothetical protein
VNAATVKPVPHGVASSFTYETLARS